VNAYLKRSVKKGLVKVSESPARRYAYDLTPQGLAEKSRLTVQYLSDSFGFFRQAKSDCARVLQRAAEKGFRRIILAGKSDLAEISKLCALDHGIEIVAVVEPGETGSRFIGLPVFPDYDAVTHEFDAVFIADLVSPRETSDAAVARFGAERVLIPDLLRVHSGKRRQVVS
jgi:hypothetical protein